MPFTLGRGAVPAWTVVRLDGAWFPDAFVGLMAIPMRHAPGEPSDPPTSAAGGRRAAAVIGIRHMSRNHGTTRPPP